MSLFENADAFAARSISTLKAGRSLDLMYYYWSTDLTGWLLVRDVLAAADRGVRVRLLLDDAHVHGLDPVYLALSRHPQIEVRLFNPTRVRGNIARRALELLLGLARFNRRMHCKAWIADGQLAIVGGRNIGDAYFGVANKGQPNTRDADIMLVGPAVAQVEDVFDNYWNSELSLPIAKLSPNLKVNLQLLRNRFGRKAKAARVQAFRAQSLDGQNAAAILIERLYWTDAVRVVADPPEKALGLRDEPWMAEIIRTVIGAANTDVQLTTPYFVPGAIGAAELTKLAQKGIDISLLTNGLSATDIVLAHGAYRRYRETILNAGINIFEFAPPMREKGKRDFLHSKVFVVDHRVAFVGSFNFDLRSAFLNTEMGVVFEQPDLIAELSEIFTRDTAPAQSYALALRGRSVQRHLARPGLAEVMVYEPEVPVFWRGFSWLVGHLPIHSYL
jgi:putative cardiolipin synthase